MKKFYVLTCTLIFVQCLCAQVGGLDPTFGSGGIEKIEFLRKENATLISEKGESFGIERGSGFDGPIRVYKYLTNGTLDVFYGNSGYTDPVTVTYYTSAIQDDGKIIVAGTIGAPFTQIKVVCFNTDGTIDFSSITDPPTGGRLYQYPVKIVKTEQGFAVLCSASSINLSLYYEFINEYVSTGLSRTYMLGVRHSPTPSPYTNDYFARNKSVLIQGGKLVVAGPEMIEPTGSPATVGNYVTYYQPSASAVRVAATMPLGSYEHMILDPNGRLIVVNAVQNSSSRNNDFRISRFNPDGSPDNTFNGTGTQITDFGSDDSAYAVVLQGDKIIVAGSTRNTTTGEAEFAIARYNNDGTLDVTFSEDGKQTLGENGYSFILENLKIEEERLIASGTITSNTGKTYKIKAAYLLKNTPSNIVLSCPPSQIVATDIGICGTKVNNIDPIITPSGSSASVSYTFAGVLGIVSGSASGTTFNKGETTVIYKLDSDPTKTCSFKIIVEDKEAPVISNVSVSPNSIWPANHKMIDVIVNYNLSDNCGITNSSLSVTSNEPQGGSDKDDVAGDWKIIDAHHVQLRAERLGKGNGRVYTITIMATDAAGNKTEQNVTVTVSHDKSVIKNAIKGPVVKLLSNPTKNSFTITLQSEDGQPASIRVIDAFGRIVEIRNSISANGTLQVGNGYKPGIYFAEIKQGNKKETITMIKY